MDAPQDAPLSSNSQAALRGEAPAIDELLQAYLPQVRAFVRMRMGNDLRKREESIDVVQSMCRRVLAHDGKDLRFASEAEFRAWLFTAALNRIKEKHRFHRAARRDLQKEFGTPDESLLQLQQGYSMLQSPSKLASAGEQIDRVEAALDGLAEDQREVISLCRLAGLSYAQAGERMGRTPEAVRKLLARSLFRLSEALGHDG
ncbi:MAG: sigma-70 family RNA polymerase sigma factor [Planctomycetota bacterium]|nr:sigma-70 family RNA polymerase sigma factor [Planctomycetota bacterium]